jgi:hypothetical protein
MGTGERERVPHAVGRPLLVVGVRHAAFAVAQLDDATGLGEPHLARDGVEEALQAVGDVVRRVVVVVQAPHRGLGGQRGVVRGQPGQHVARVEHVAGDDRARRTGPADRAVVRRRRLWVAERRLGLVVRLVPRRDDVYPGVAREEPADRRLVGGDVRELARLVGAPADACAVEGHERLHARRRGGSEPRVERCWLGVDRVPGRDEARRANAERPEARIGEHRRSLLAHARDDVPIAQARRRRHAAAAGGPRTRREAAQIEPDAEEARRRRASARVRDDVELAEQHAVTAQEGVRGRVQLHADPECAAWAHPDGPRCDPGAPARGPHANDDGSAGLAPANDQTLQRAASLVVDRDALALGPEDAGRPAVRGRGSCASRR